MNRAHPTAHRGISKAFTVTVLVIIVLAGLALALITQTKMTGTATLNDLIAGKFPTALDKAGTGGVTVTVTDLRVIYVRTESDGDWHVAVTDGVIPVFITEITPSYQAKLGQPQPGSVIQETGIAYCDTVHETESWHGNTCWEKHHDRDYQGQRRLAGRHFLRPRPNPTRLSSSDHNPGARFGWGLGWRNR